ncbi:hypothetical protein CEXT_698101 [Caerostris extrusa]|uniref:Uncharacterized protein n=1 Tax=Caerostris extrusa TaxID=172846 RepID=A0AAV4UKG3_CAEEX|nr:hypothetical protein CEXT_698101 [Caerostris extrusa]
MDEIMVDTLNNLPKTTFVKPVSLAIPYLISHSSRQLEMTVRNPQFHPHQTAHPPLFLQLQINHLCIAYPRPLMSMEGFTSTLPSL